MIVGSWGDGVFDSDTALDVLSKVTHPLESYIHSAVLYMQLNPREDEYFEYTIRGFMGAIYLFWRLALESDTCILPSATIINHWRQVFFKAWSENQLRANSSPQPETDLAKHQLISDLLDDLEAGCLSNPKKISHKNVAKLELFKYPEVKRLVTYQLMELMEASIQSLFFEYEKVLYPDHTRQLFDVLPAVEIIYLLAWYADICPPPSRIIKLWQEKLGTWASRADIDYDDEDNIYRVSVEMSFAKLLKLSENCNNKYSS
jgi:hypothetical protein